MCFVFLLYKISKTFIYTERVESLQEHVSVRGRRLTKGVCFLGVTILMFHQGILSCQHLMSDMFTLFADVPTTWGLEMATGRHTARMVELSLILNSAIPNCLK